MNLYYLSFAAFVHLERGFWNTISQFDKFGMFQTSLLEFHCYGQRSILCSTHYSLVSQVLYTELLHDLAHIAESAKYFKSESAMLSQIFFNLSSLKGRSPI